MGTGDEPDGEEDEDGGADVGHEDLDLRQPQRHEARQLQVCRRVGVPHCRGPARLLDLDRQQGLAAAADLGSRRCNSCSDSF